MSKPKKNGPGVTPPDHLTLGEIRMFAAPGAQPPPGWMFCEGQTLEITDHESLYSLLQTTYGGNGSTTFCLPDLRGRTVVGTGQGPHLTNRSLADTGGAEMVDLTEATMPSHQHWFNASATVTRTTSAANDRNPDDLRLAKTADSIYAGAADGDVRQRAASDVQVTLGQPTSQSAGPSNHNNMPPFAATRFLIAVTGLLPSRP